MDKSSGSIGRPNPPVSRFWWFIAGVVAVVILAFWLRPRPPVADPTAAAPVVTAPGNWAARSTMPVRPFSRAPTASIHPTDPGPPPEQVVHDKLIRFAHSRRKLMHDMAERFKIKVPAKFEQ